MGIILKFLLRNIREKRLRTVLIVVSITLSSALFFATTAMSTTMERMYARRLSQYFGTAELVVHAERRSPSRFLRPPDSAHTPSSAAYVVGVFQLGSEFKLNNATHHATIVGIEYGDLAVMNPMTVEVDGGIEPFKGRKVIVSRSTADRYGFKAGDTVVAEFDDRRFRFQIAGIAAPTGFFTDDGQNETFVVPRETIASLNGARGRASVLFARSKPSAGVETLRADLAKLYPRYTVRDTVSSQQLQEWTDSIATPFRIMLVLVLAISAFIIFTSFHVITIERLPVIGTFRSVGATRRTTDLVLFAESLLYGAGGGLIGCLIGIGILYVMTDLASSGWMRAVQTRVAFYPWQEAAAFGVAVLLSVASAAIPILKVSRIPVKDVILGLYRHESRFKRRRLTTGALLLPAGIIIPWFVPRSVALVVDTLCILVALTGVTLLIPLITRGFIALFERLFTRLFGNIGVLAAKNLRGNASILNNVALLAIAISGLFMINTISRSAAVSLSNFYRDADHQIELWLWPMNRSVLQNLRTVEGVDDVCGIYAVHDVQVEGRTDQIRIIHGVEPADFQAFQRIQSGGRQLDLSPVEEGREMFIAESLARQLSVEPGQSLTLDLPRGRKEYRIAGTFSSLMWNGSYAIVGDRYLKMDAQLTRYDSIYVKTTGDPNEAEKRIKEKYARRRPWVMTVQAMEERNRQSNEQMFLILQGFSVLALLIGTIGIVNNFLISFIERRRSFALFRSVGMSRRQNRLMILIEAAAGGAIGATLGVATGSLLLLIVPRILYALRLPIGIFYSGGSAAALLAGGILITLAASLSPAMKSSKLNILQALRYE